MRPAAPAAVRPAAPAVARPVAPAAPAAAQQRQQQQLQMQQQRQQAVQQRQQQQQQIQQQRQQAVQQRQQQQLQIQQQRQQAIQQRQQQQQQIQQQRQQAIQQRQQQQLQIQQQRQQMLQQRPAAPGVQGQPPVGMQRPMAPGVQGQPPVGMQRPMAPGVQGQPPVGMQRPMAPGMQGQRPGVFQGGPQPNPPVGFQPPQQPVRRNGGGISPAGAAAIGLGVGLVGGAILSNQMRGVTEVHQHRETFVDGGVRYVREPGRVIIREEGAPAYIRHDEAERFAILGYRPQVVHEGGFVRAYYDRPDGVRIITVTDPDGRLVRRIRRYPDGREVIIIDNSFRPRPARFVDQVVVLPPPPLTIPRERYIVDAGVADEATIYEALTAPPLTRVSRRYSLDEVRYSPDLRAQMRSVDVNTITFESGSWEVGPNQVQRLSAIAAAIGKAIERNPEEVFLIEGHTDAVGDADDNLSLSDRRAQSVAEILSRDFGIPAENLTTQGYGETQLRVHTEGDARANRRVTVRRITPLIAEQQQSQQ